MPPGNKNPGHNLWDCEKSWGRKMFGVGGYEFKGCNKGGGGVLG